MGGGVFLPLACVFGQTHRSAPTLWVVVIFRRGAPALCALCLRFLSFCSSVLKLLLCIRGGVPLAVEEYFFLLLAYSGRHIGLPLHCGWLLFALGAHRCVRPFACVSLFLCPSVLLFFCPSVLMFFCLQPFKKNSLPFRSILSPFSVSAKITSKTAKNVVL